MTDIAATGDVAHLGSQVATTIKAMRQIAGEWPAQVFEYPTADGGVQFEWSTGGHEISVEIYPYGAVYCHDTNLADVTFCWFLCEWWQLMLAVEWLEWQIFRNEVPQ